MDTLIKKGLIFTNRLIDRCLELEIEPWVTLYHWDLPHNIELRGGWTNRRIVDWFFEYTAFLCRSFWRSSETMDGAK